MTGDYHDSPSNWQGRHFNHVLGGMMRHMLKARPRPSVLKRDPTLTYAQTSYTDTNDNVICQDDYIRYTHKDATTGVGIAGGEGLVKRNGTDGWAVENVTPYGIHWMPLDGLKRDDTDVYIRNDLRKSRTQKAT